MHNMYNPKFILASKNNKPFISDTNNTKNPIHPHKLIASRLINNSQGINQFGEVLTNKLDKETEQRIQHAEHQKKQYETVIQLRQEQTQLQQEQAQLQQDIIAKNKLYKEMQLKREQELKLQQENKAKLKLQQERKKEEQLQREKIRQEKLKQEKEAKLQREHEVKLQQERKKTEQLKQEKLKQEKAEQLQLQQLQLQQLLQQEKLKQEKLKQEKEAKFQEEKAEQLQEEKAEQLNKELKLQRDKALKLQRDRELQLAFGTGMVSSNAICKLTGEQELQAKEAKLKREQEVKLQQNPELFKFWLNPIKIINVYQNIYAKGFHASGIGDFIRGSFFLMQFCSDVGYAYEIDLSNHHISKFLENSPQNMNNDYSSYNDQITNFEYRNENITKVKVINNSQVKVITNYPGNKTNTITKFKKYLNVVPINNKTMKVYTITFPYKKLTNDERQKMRVIMEPTNIIISGGQNVLNYLGLYGKTYTCIHIRLGDSYINDSSYNEANNKKIKTITKILGPLNKESKYLLISDNNSIKQIISTLLPNVRGFEHDISHTGEGSILTDTNMKNTMIDFYLLSQAATILSLTVYKHGSGFSKWCAEIYNIPYTCCLI